MYKVETVPAPALTTEDEAAIRAIIAGLETSWNAADGVGYSQPFAEDADFVTIYGQYVQGRAAIAGGHQQIFDTVYRGSRNRCKVEAIRALAPGVALARVQWTLRVPTGNGEREGVALNSLVLVHDGKAWQIAVFHNTLITQPGAAGPFVPSA